jgi:hypothetical protein
MMPKQKMAMRAEKIADLQQQIATLKAARDKIKGGCKSFCVNGQRAGYCPSSRSHYDRKQTHETPQTCC